MSEHSLITLAFCNSFFLVQNIISQLQKREGKIPNANKFVTVLGFKRRVKLKEIIFFLILLLFGD